MPRNDRGDRESTGKGWDAPTEEEDLFFLC